MRAPKNQSAVKRFTACFGKVAFLLVLVCGCTQQPIEERSSADGKSNQIQVPDRVQTETPRLVLLYIPCTVNRAYLSPYNETVIYTPAIDEFGRDSLVFERHQTEAGQSGIAYSSIFSGVQANRHGFFAHPKAMEDSLYVITEAFRDAGYDTWFWTGQLMATAALAGQGTRVIAHPFLSASGIETDRRFEELLQRVKDDSEYKAFVITAFTQTHGPYLLKPLKRFCADFPEECTGIADLSRSQITSLYGMYKKNYLQLIYNLPETSERLGLHGDRLERLAALLDALYKANINALDHRFSKLIKQIKEKDLYDSSIIAFTVDHGESTFRRNAIFQWNHGHTLNPEVIQVPWMLRAPSRDVIPGRYESVTRSIDVYPTLAALASVDILSNDPIDGVDLSLSLKGDQPPPSLLAYSHTSLIPLPPWFAKQSETWTLFHSYYPRRDPALIWVMVRKDDLVVKMTNVGNEVFRFAAYDLAQDPYETLDIYDDDVLLHRELQKQLETYKRTLVDSATARFSVKPKISLDDQEVILRSMGYLN